MKARVSQISGGAIEGMPWLGTFHSVAARMLRSHAELVGLQSNFTSLDTDDQLRVLKQLISAANLDEKRWPARQLAGLIDRWKNRGWTPNEVDLGEAESFGPGRGRELYAASGAAHPERCDRRLRSTVVIFAPPDVRKLPHRSANPRRIQDTKQSQSLMKLLASPPQSCERRRRQRSILARRTSQTSSARKGFPGAKASASRRTPARPAPSSRRRWPPRQQCGRSQDALDDKGEAEGPRVGIGTAEERAA